MNIDIRFTARNSDSGAYIVWDNQQKATVLGYAFNDLTAAQDAAIDLNKRLREPAS